jgi:hypothetical protein
LKQDHRFYEPYFKSRLFAGNSWILFAVILIFVVGFFIFKSDIFDKPLAPEKIKSSIEVFNISSHWVVKKKIEEDDFKGIVLVPEISFRVRNVGDSELSYVFLLGVFRFLDNGKTIGEGFKTVFKEPLKPGKESDKLKLTSELGYRASSAEAFEKNQRDWQSAYVEIFVKFRSSKLVFLKSYYISRKIQGRKNIDVKI